MSPKKSDLPKERFGSKGMARSLDSRAALRYAGSAPEGGTLRRVADRSRPYAQGRGMARNIRLAPTSAKFLVKLIISPICRSLGAFQKSCMANVTGRRQRTT